MCNNVRNSVYDIGNTFFIEDDDLFFQEIDNYHQPIEEISNQFGIYSSIWPIVQTMVQLNDIGNINTNILLQTNQSYSIYNFLGNTKYNKQVTNNLYNFSLAKTFHFMKNLKRIVKSGENVDERASKLTNIVYNNQMKTETKQVSHITENTNNIVKNQAISQKILKFVTYQDGKVRDSHEHLNGMTLPANSSKWNEANSILSEWGCRCQIIEVLDQNPELKSVNKITIAKSSVASEVDIKSGKVEIFKDSLPTFGGTEVIRKYYRREI